MFKMALNVVDVKCDFYSYRNADNAFNYLKHKTLFQFHQIPRIFNKNITFIVNNWIKHFHLFYLILKYNTFIFNFPHTLLPGNKDLVILKFFRKKIITVLSGCPDRDVSLYPDDKEYICNRCVDEDKKRICLCKNIELKKSRVRKFEQISSAVISQSDSAGYLYQKDFIWYHVIAEKPDQKDYLAKFNSNEIIITHFPSNPIIKLSHIIVPVLEEIANERPNVKLIIKTKIPHAEVLKHLDDTHILVDALGLSYGVLGIEGMARGCVTVVGNMPFINEKLNDNPLISSTTKNLKENILRLIDDKKMLIEHAERSLNFFNKYHAVESAGVYYKKTLNLN